MVSLEKPPLPAPAPFVGPIEPPSAFYRRFERARSLRGAK